MFDDNKKIGIGLCALGMFLGGVGVVFLFDRALLALGNLAFLGGISALLGITKTAKFFFKPEKLRGSAFFFGGFFIIIWGWAILGILLQAYGVWCLFSAFLPNLVSSIRLTPVGMIFDLPGFKRVAQWVYDQRRLPL